METSPNKKILNDRETRKKLWELAHVFGCRPELKQIWQRYDPLYQKTSDLVERKQISIMANAEIHRLFNFRNALVVDGVEIIPADDNYQEII